jgi:hypothetical protein
LICLKRYGGGTPTTNILRYSVSLDKVEKVSSLSSAAGGGLAIQSKDGKTIYFFGGYPNHAVVHKFDPFTNLTVRLPSEIPASIFYDAGVSINGTIFLFDGRGKNVLEFSEETETARIIADLSFFDGTSSVATVAALPDNQDSIWLFAENTGMPTYPILQFNRTTKTVQIPNVDTTSLPTLYYSPVAVKDSSHGYLVGGIGRDPEEDGSFHPGNGMLRYFKAPYLKVFL